MLLVSIFLEEDREHTNADHFTLLIQNSPLITPLRVFSLGWGSIIYKRGPKSGSFLCANFKGKLLAFCYSIFLDIFVLPSLAFAIICRQCSGSYLVSLVLLYFWGGSRPFKCGCPITTRQKKQYGFLGTTIVHNAFFFYTFRGGSS